MRAELFDAGTFLVIDPLATPTPGMDQAFYREIDMEYKWPQERPGEINEQMRVRPTTGTLRPWPAPFPYRQWIDQTPRYEGEDGGLQLETYHVDDILGVTAPVPAELAQIETSAAYSAGVNIDRRFERMGRNLTLDEIAERTPTPNEWLRLLLYNEPGAATSPVVGGVNVDLRDPAVMIQRAHTGPGYRVVGNYSPLFAPFDLRRPEWYQVVDEDGAVLPDGEKEAWLSLRHDGFYRLYLRPANWRWAVTVVAHYLYVSWFEMFPTDEWFTLAYFNRPPVWPVRHDLIHTTQVAWYEYRNVLYSLDNGIEWSFEHSRGAGELRRQMLDSQWHSLSEAYIYTGNDPATIVLWMWPPEPGDIVLGIGRVDYPSGREDLRWVMQKADLTAEFPRTVIGQYIDLTFTAF